MIPGSLDDLRRAVATGNQAPFLEWLERNRQLVADVESGRVECCGEHALPGYYGWCSLLTKPAVFREGRICFQCPKATPPAGSPQSLPETEANFGAAPGEPVGALTEGEIQCKS